MMSLYNQQSGTDVRLRRMDMGMKPEKEEFMKGSAALILFTVIRAKTV